MKHEKMEEFIMLKIYKKVKKPLSAPFARRAVFGKHLKIVKRFTFYQSLKTAQTTASFVYALRMVSCSAIMTHM